MAKKSSQESSNNALKHLSFGVVATGLTYGFGILAIDSGSLWHYALTFAAIYFAVHYIKLAIKEQFFNNDKTRKAKPAKS